MISDTISIYDLPNLGAVTAQALVEQTLSKHPRLRDLYDEDFVRRLIQRRRGQNYLLLLLVRPDDHWANDFWTSVVDDLTLLESDRSLHHFRSKLRLRDREDIESARTELALAAKTKRTGAAITLEPVTRNGRDCDFVADTVPRTWWEIKSILDLDYLIADEAVSFDVHTRLRRIEEPYVLVLHPSTIRREDVPKAVRDIKRQVAAHYRLGGSLPAVFGALGLVVEAAQLTKQKSGYIGIGSSGLHVFGNEHSKKIGSRIVSAVEQLPENQAGIVVIDTTVATWVDQEDVIDACFGVESGVYRNGCMIPVRDTDAGVFQPHQRTRISAVLHYTRHAKHKGEPNLLIHNPFARTPLPEGALAADDVVQLRRVEREHGHFALVRNPDSDSPN